MDRNPAAGYPAGMSKPREPQPVRTPEPTITHREHHADDRLQGPPPAPTGELLHALAAAATALLDERDSSQYGRRVRDLRIVLSQVKRRADG